MVVRNGRADAPRAGVQQQPEGPVRIPVQFEEVVAAPERRRCLGASRSQAWRSFWVDRGGDSSAGGKGSPRPRWAASPTGMRSAH
ncbi:hypothetical protein QEG98_01670 [Myxococcus sp. MxC21-1]|nr:hypothetical protein QEG98_01670 [Myxococcus sp. MxC21-1]